MTDPPSRRLEGIGGEDGHRFTLSLEHGKWAAAAVLRPYLQGMHLTLLRHGRSLADDEGVHEGRYDSPLTDAGRAQAQALAAYWQRHPPGFDRLVCSPLVRGHETARVVSAALNLQGPWQRNGPANAGR